MSGPYDAVRREVLLRGRDDWVGLWEVARLVREQDGMDVRGQTLAVVAALHADGLVTVGTVTDESGEYTAWPGTTDDVVARIGRAWDDLGHEPDVYDICWLSTTAAGDAVTTSGRTSPPDQPTIGE